MHPLIGRTPYGFKRAAVCALVALIAAHPAQAATAVAPTAQQIAEYESVDETTRVKLLMHLARSGKQDLAADLLQRYPLTGKHAANRTLFLQGLILEADGDLTAAVKKFRSALASDPNLTLVRAELAKTLAQLDEDESAKHHLDILAQSAPSEETARGIRSFIEQVDHKKPLKFSAFVSAAPTTNINGGSNHSTMTVYDPYSGSSVPASINKRKSGVGASVGGSVGFSRRVGNDFYLVTAGNAYAALYQDTDFNTYGLSESAELRYMLDRGYFGLGGVASQGMALYDVTAIDTDYEHVLSYGPRISAQYNITVHDRINASAVYTWKDSLERDKLDGTDFTANASLEHTFDPSLSVSAFGGFNRNETGIKYNSFRQWSGGVGVYKELPAGFTIDARAQAMVSDFDAIHPAIATAARKDTRLSGTLEVTKRDLNIFGFAPAVSYSYVRNRSNVDMYDYDSHTVDFRLTKDF